MTQRYLEEETVMSLDDLHNKSRITKEALVAFLQLVEVVIDRVKDAGPQGAPAGPLYATLMSAGMTLQQFEQMMDAIVKSGRLRKSGHLYFYVDVTQETKP
jgi:hypothetical protein